MKDQSKNFNPHRNAIAAMWLYGDRYSKQSGGCMDFWESLSDTERETVQRMVQDIENTRIMSRAEMISPKPQTL